MFQIPLSFFVKLDWNWVTGCGGKHVHRSMPPDFLILFKNGGKIHLMLCILSDCQSDWMKYTRAVILFCALSAPFLCLPSHFILCGSFTFSTDLELTSVNLQPSAFLSHLSLCNLFCKFNLCELNIFIRRVDGPLLLGLPNTLHYKILVFNHLC